MIENGYKFTKIRLFSRNLKPALPHQVKNFEEHIDKAFKNSYYIILDSEVLMI